MKSLITTLCVASIILIGAGCRKEEEKPAAEKTEVKQTEAKQADTKQVKAKSADDKIPEIVVGGLYAFPNKDRMTYVIMKVLALDKKIVHVRRYVNRFQEVPKELDTSTLTLGDVGMPGNTGLPHMALGIDWFWPSKPELLKTEPVTEEEQEVVEAFRQKRRK